jgi:F-type H+-transporting ATPase subunit alpha
MDLAQYRELATFAQFGTELDKTSQAQLDRGDRLTEVLKQDQYSPLPVEKQILIIYAGNRGYLDGFPVSRMGEYEEKLFDYFEREHIDLMKQIVEEKKISAELDEAIAQALTAFNQTFAEETE